MTAPFRQTMMCPKCSEPVIIEDPALSWIRSHPSLDSFREGLTITDKDLIVHRYKTSFGRGFQCIMSVEIKTFNRRMSESQRDTLHMWNQFLRNRKTTPTKKKVMQIEGLDRVYSVKNQRWVKVKAFGAHLLRLSRSTPDDSDEIMWDKEFIDLNVLIEILRFDRDPDTLEKMDWRKHHVDKFAHQSTLPIT